MHVVKKTIILSILFFPSFFAYAQDSSTVILNPYGDDYREPKVFGTGYISPAPSPVVTPPAQNTTTSPQPEPAKEKDLKSSITTPTSLFETTKTDKPAFSNFFNSKLRLDIKAQSTMCEAGAEKSIPWLLVNNGVDIDTVDELRATIDQAMQADKRIRRVVVKDTMLDVYYLQPARIFSLIPINYLYKVSIDTNNFQINITDPSWHKFAKTFHKETSSTLSQGLSQIYTSKNLEYITTQNQYYKHSFSITAVSSVFNTIDMYPFANTFWICTIVPYFVVFLLLFGILLGFLLYYWAKRKKDKFIRRFKNGEFSKKKFDTDSVVAPTSHFRELPRMNDDHDDNESLEDYVKSKRFK
jgi:hypothetical protein